MKKSDRIWKHYLHILEVIDRTNISKDSSEYRKLNKTGWRLVGKYIEELNKEFKLKI